MKSNAARRPQPGKSPKRRSGRRPFGEQVAHRARPAAEEVAEQRVDASEAPLAGGLEGPEQEPRHGLRGAVRDLTALTAAERALLGDWLDRIAEALQREVQAGIS